MRIDLNQVALPTYDVIPDGTIAHARVTLKRGGYIAEGYEDGWVTQSNSSSALFLACQFELLDGEFKNRVVTTNIGLFSEKSDLFAEIGLKTMRQIIDSAYDLKADVPDTRRDIKDYGALDNLVCVCKIKVKMQQYNGEMQPKNEVQVLTPGSKEYQMFKLENAKPSVTTFTSVTLNKGAIAPTVENGRFKINEKKTFSPAEPILRDDEIPF